MKYANYALFWSLYAMLFETAEYHSLLSVNAIFRQHFRLNQSPFFEKDVFSVLFSQQFVNSCEKTLQNRMLKLLTMTSFITWLWWLSLWWSLFPYVKPPSIENVLGKAVWVEKEIRPEKEIQSLELNGNIHRHTRTSFQCSSTKGALANQKQGFMWTMMFTCRFSWNIGSVHVYVRNLFRNDE